MSKCPSLYPSVSYSKVAKYKGRSSHATLLLRYTPRLTREKATKDMLAYMALSKYMQHSCYCQAGQNNRTDNCVGSGCQIYGPPGYRHIYLHIRCLRESPESVSRVCDWSNLCDLNPGFESELTGKQNPWFWPRIDCQDLDHAYIYGI